MKGAIIDRPPTRFHHRTRRAYGLLPPALPVGELSAQLTERGKAANGHVVWGETKPVGNLKFNLYDLLEDLFYGG